MRAVPATIDGGIPMKTVQYEEVSDLFQSRFVDSEEYLFHSIAWDCLTKAGFTAYSNEKERAHIYLYAYAIQLLCEEFYSMAYDEYGYDLELFGEEPLTDAAIAELYRALIADDESVTEERLENMDAGDMLAELVSSVQEKVESVIFDQLGSTLIGALLYNAVTGIPKEDGFCEDDDEEAQSDLFPINERFHTKEALLNYAKDMGNSFLFCLPDSNAMRLQEWISDHPDHVKH